MPSMLITACRVHNGRGSTRLRPPQPSCQRALRKQCHHPQNLISALSCSPTRSPVASFASRRGYNNIWTKGKGGGWAAGGGGGYGGGMSMTQQRNAEYKDRAGLHGESRRWGGVKMGGGGHGKGNWGAAGS